MEATRTYTARALAVAMLVAFVVALAPAPASSAPSEEAFEACLLDEINQARADNGAPPVEMALDLNPLVREWSEWMRYNDFRHMNDAEREPILPDDWYTWAENIAYHGNPNLPDCSTIHTMFMNSPGHRANILNANQTFVALGAYTDASGWWVTQLFFASHGYSASCEGTFCDDDASVFQADIEKLAAAGITKGCNAEGTRFCPNDRVTRGQMAAFMVNALGLEDRLDDPFVDDDGSVFEPSIEKLAAAGITNGCNAEGTRFCPTDHVTRGQMAAFIVNALGLEDRLDDPFVDDDGSVFEPSIEKLAAAGITNGCGAGSDRYCPSNYVTRGQMAAFLSRALDL